MNRVKTPVGIEILPPFLREKEEPLKRDNVFGCEAVKGIRSGCDKIAAAFIFHEKTIGHVFMGKVKMVGQGLAKHTVFIAEPDSKRRSGTAPVTLIKLKILAPVFRLFSERIQRFVHYKSTGRHRFELVYGKIKLGTKKEEGQPLPVSLLSSLITSLVPVDTSSSLSLSLAILRQQEPVTHRVLKRR